MLLPDPVEKTYSADVINPGKLKFIKDSTLGVNYSPLPGAFVLGGIKAGFKPGERMMAAYSNAQKELLP